MQYVLITFMADGSHTAETRDRAEWRLATLDELIEIGMDMARSLRSEATEFAGGYFPLPHGRRDPRDLFASLSRAIRLTLALQARLETDPGSFAPDPEPDRPGRGVEDDEDLPPRSHDAEPPVPSPAPEPKSERDLARDLVRDLIEFEVGDPVERGERHRGLLETLREVEDFNLYDGWPFRAVVERLCAALGLRPDWSQWTGTGWANVPAAAGSNPPPDAGSFRTFGRIQHLPDPPPGARPPRRDTG